MLGLGFVLAALAGLLAWRLQALTLGGALGATIIGGLVFGFGGLTWAAVLLTFFVGSSLLSYFGAERKARAMTNFGKQGPRDFAQTLANGGLAALLALIVGLVGHDSSLYPYLALAYFGAMAAVTADTWATELGMLSPSPPRLITNGRPTQPGVSGGVTRTGLLASLGGAFFMAATTFAFIQAAALVSTGQWFWQDWFLLLVLPVAGFAGSVADSFLGATWQRLYHCQRCNVFTEEPIHSCGSQARLVRGWPWMNNEVVNFLASVTGAIVAILASLLILVR